MFIIYKLIVVNIDDIVYYMPVTKNMRRIQGGDVTILEGIDVGTDGVGAALAANHTRHIDTATQAACGGKQRNCNSRRKS